MKAIGKINVWDKIIIESPQTNFEKVEFIRKNALLDWINKQMSLTDYVEHGYRVALEELRKYID